MIIEKGPEKTEPDQFDWCRLAAFIDGDGTIMIGRNSTEGARKRGFATPRMWLRVMVCNTDPRMARWCAKTFGGTATRDTSTARAAYGHRPMYRWHVTCRKAARIIEGVRPFLLIKREQADLALAFQETLGWKGGQGVPTPPELMERRESIHGELKLLKKTTPAVDSPIPERLIS